MLPSCPAVKPSSGAAGFRALYCPWACVVCVDAHHGPAFRAVAAASFRISPADIAAGCPRRVDHEPPLPPIRTPTQRDLGHEPDWAPCDACDHQHWPSGAVRGCQLIEGGQPCALGARLRQGGPWPPGCPRQLERN